MEINHKLRPFFESKGQNADDCILYLLAKKHGLKYKCSEETFEFLSNLRFITLNLLTNVIICTVGVYEGETITLPEVDLTVEQTIRERIDEYRQLFKGIRSGSIGEKQKVINLLTQFCLENNKSFDQVLETTKIYMSYTDFHLISNADNFISKVDKNGDEISLLKIAMEEQDMNGDSEQRTYKLI